MLVERNQCSKCCRGQLVQQDGGARPIAGVVPVRVVGLPAYHQGFGLGDHVGQQHMMV